MARPDEVKDDRQGSGRRTAVLRQDGLAISALPEERLSKGAREVEDDQMARCSEAARDGDAVVRDQREANVFRLGALVMDRRRMAEYANLMRVSERYFEAHPNERISTEEVVQRRWVPDLPRFAERLRRSLDAIGAK